MEQIGIVLAIPLFLVAILWAITLILAPFYLYGVYQRSKESSEYLKEIRDHITREHTE